MGLLPQPSELPPFPKPAALVQLLAIEPDATIEEYVRVVGSDPAFTTQILMMANSAHARGFEPVASAHAAIVRLGTDITRRAVTTMAVRSAFGAFEEAALDTQALWWHLLGTGLLTEALTPSREEKHTAFTAGLLHDLGRLSLASLDPPRYRRVVLRVRAGHDVFMAEREEFGVSHASWGVRLARHWRLPRVLTEAIGSHHEGEDPLSARIASAREMLSALGFGDGVVEPQSAELETTSAQPSPGPLAAFGGLEGFTSRLQRFADV